IYRHIILDTRSNGSITSWTKPAEEVVPAELLESRFCQWCRHFGKGRKYEELQNLQFYQWSRKTKNQKNMENENVCETTV
ncbi:MAG: hypothetical protein WCP97_09190, partial [bacterium]